MKDTGIIIVAPSIAWSAAIDMAERLGPNHVWHRIGGTMFLTDIPRKAEIEIRKGSRWAKRLVFWDGEVRWITGIWPYAQLIIWVHGVKNAVNWVKRGSRK